MKSFNVITIVLLFPFIMLTSCNTVNQRLVASFISKSYGLSLTDYLFYWNFKVQDPAIWQYYYNDMAGTVLGGNYSEKESNIESILKYNNESLMYRYRNDDPRNKFISNLNYEINTSKGNIKKLTNILYILSIEADIINDDIEHYNDVINYSKYFVMINDGKISGFELLDNKISKESLISRYHDCISDYNSILEFINKSGTIILRYDKQSIELAK